MSDFVRKSDVLDLLYVIFDKYKMSTDKNTSIGKSFGTDVFEEIRNMPTAYYIDKVVEELEERQKEYLAGFGVHNNDEMYGVACGLGDAIKIVKQGCAYDDDVCEWESDYEFVSDKYKRETGCGYTFYDLHHAVPFKFCPYCGKKIKVVEQNDN